MLGPKAKCWELGTVKVLEGIETCAQGTAQPSGQGKLGQTNAGLAMRPTAALPLGLVPCGLSFRAQSGEPGWDTTLWL